MKQKITKNIPKLRFSEFGGEWKKKRLGDIAMFWNGKAHEQHISENGNFIVVNSKFVSTEGKVKKYSNTLISPIKKDDITIVMSDIPNGKAIGKCYLIKENGKYTLNQRIGGIHSEMVISQFLVNIINRNKYFLKFDNSVSQTNLRKDEILSCPVTYPSIEEQKKIASFMSKVDGWVENLKNQKENLEKYKKGMMQKIFSQETRFKDNDGKGYPDWSNKKLEEVCKVVGGFAFKSEQFKKSGITIIRISNISNDNKYMNMNNLVYYDPLENENSFVIQQGNVLIALSGATTGKTSIYDQPTKAYLNQRVGLFKILKTGAVDYSFLTQFIFSDLFSKQISKVLVAGAQPNLSPKDIEKFEILLPTIKEQQKIAEFLTSLDNLIESKQKEIKLAEAWKKGLMQRMFV